jgi:hypothetical protein
VWGMRHLFPLQKKLLLLSLNIFSSYMFQNQRVFSVLDFKLFYNHAAFACIVKCRSFTLFFLNSSQVLYLGTAAK